MHVYNRGTGSVRAVLKVRNVGSEIRDEDRPSYEATRLSGAPGGGAANKKKKKKNKNVEERLEWTYDSGRLTTGAN